MNLVTARLYRIIILKLLLITFDQKPFPTRVQICWGLQFAKKFDNERHKKLRMQSPFPRGNSSPSLSLPSTSIYPYYSPLFTLLKVTLGPGRCKTLAWKMKIVLHSAFISVSGAPFHLSITKCDNIESHRGSLLTMIHPQRVRKHIWHWYWLGMLSST